jgi:hypothetical protein
MTWRLEDLHWLIEAPANIRALCNAIDESPAPIGADISRCYGAAARKLHTSSLM